MTSVFSSLHESLQQVLAQRLDWSDLREVQEQAYAAVTGGNDALLIAPTAGGKSEAALIPVMDDILKNGRAGVTCLYLSPLKALINDQEERFRVFCVPTSLSVMKWHGDVPKGDRSWKDEPPHFLMITPESLEVLLQERTLSADLRQVRYIIIDELHAFVESERGVHLKVLLDRMDQLAKRKIQRIGLSATTGNPEEILHWLSDDRRGAVLVAVPAPPQEKQFSFLVEPAEGKRVDAVAGIVKGRKALVFVNSRSSAENLASALRGRISNLHIHHSSLSSETRKSAEDAFLAQGGACIICTSTLELGIDIGDLDVVVQVGPPDSVSSFLQRMGRSGRRGKAAYVAWVLADACELLCSCAIIECAMDRDVEKLRPLEKPFNVLLQQFFLLLHRQHRAGRRKMVSDLLSHPVFAGITREDIDHIIRHLIAEGYIATDGEMLMFGTEAERVLGKSNWKDLYSVINGGGEYRAVTPDGDVVGKLDARFVNSHTNGEISLGGQTWSMVKCDDGHNLVVVVPSGAGVSRTFWTSSGESGFSALICERIGQIRAQGESVLPLGEPEQELIGGLLATIPEGVSGYGLYVLEKIPPGRREVVVYSLHGSRFNRVLAMLLQKRLGRKVQVRFTDFLLRVTGAGKTGAGAKVMSALESIREMTRDEIETLLPVPRRDGWKFASLLPDRLFAACAIPGYYHTGEFVEMISLQEIALLPVPPPDTPTGTE
ncbi:DEAD/DEAH box helicase [Methanoregula sp.]|uniref:DEAD/DEAH box helicase n=1 Tax=Methanoregula sp. TaxID=2052170 RepID=UPI00236DEE43|nr:DEAD/DEAH box helicase [Methanoregula sp.]MDD1686753.1 DEAD/DEAH box helicase [Methanoregula sp.]